MIPKINHETASVDPAAGLFVRHMRRLRLQRWCLWTLLLGYIPLIWVTLEVSGSDKATFKVFAGWVIVLFFVVLRLAVVRCPRCHNTFHMHGFIPLYLRRCLHCGLHVTAKSAESP